MVDIFKKVVRVRYVDYNIGSTAFDFRFKNRAWRRRGVKILLPLIEDMIRQINIGRKQGDGIEYRGELYYTIKNGNNYIKYDKQNIVIYDQEWLES